MADSQNFANHTRWHPLYHFVALPVMLINVIWAIVAFIIAPGWNSGWWVVVSLALALMPPYLRTYSFTVQARVIRLEEKVRSQQLLSPAALQQAEALTVGQVVALRFAGDEELETLLNQTVAGRFAKTKDIKQAIKSWRAEIGRASCRER